jgi:SNF family Na+-dependent transporter
MTQRSTDDAWTGRGGFILAAIGSAIGLGNIWRFSYVAGENGGAAFLLVYGLCVLFIGLPVLLAEFVLGSRTRGDVMLAFSHRRAAGVWQGAGALAALVACLILSYYSVIARWACRARLPPQRSRSRPFSPACPPRSAPASGARSASPGAAFSKPWIFLQRTCSCPS